MHANYQTPSEFTARWQNGEWCCCGCSPYAHADDAVYLCSENYKNRERLVPGFLLATKVFRHRLIRPYDCEPIDSLLDCQSLTHA